MLKLEQIEDKDFYEVFGIDYDTGSLIEKLLQNSAINERLERVLFQRLYSNTISETDGEKIIEYLYQNQINPITSGNTYQMSDIKRQFKKHIK